MTSQIIWKQIEGDGKKTIERGREPYSPRSLLFSAPLLFFFFCRQFRYFPRATYLSLFICTVNAIVFSKFFHCYSVWAGTSKGNIARLLLVENFAAIILSVERI